MYLYHNQHLFKTCKLLTNILSEPETNAKVSNHAKHYEAVSESKRVRVKEQQNMACRAGKRRG